MIRMSHDDLRDAYATATMFWGLKHQQRTALDRSDLYLDIMIAVYQQRFQGAENLLWDAEILTAPVVKF